jgi:hypothetical protein
MENFLCDDLPNRQRDILKGQTALVAGASSGIGQGLTNTLLRRWCACGFEFFIQWKGCKWS